MGDPWTTIGMARDLWDICVNESVDSTDRVELVNMGLKSVKSAGKVYLVRKVTALVAFLEEVVPMPVGASLVVQGQITVRRAAVESAMDEAEMEWLRQKTDAENAHAKALSDLDAAKRRRIALEVAAPPVAPVPGGAVGAKSVLTMVEFNTMCSEYKTRHGFDVPERRMPSFKLLEKMSSAKTTGTFPVVPLKDLMTDVEQTTDATERALKRKTKEMVFDQTSGTFIEKESDEIGMLPCHKLITKIEIYATSLDLLKIGKEQDWIAHTEELFSVHDRFKKRMTEIIFAESLARSDIAKTYARNGNDMSAAVATSYAVGGAAYKIWKNYVTDIDPDQTVSAKAKAKAKPMTAPKSYPKVFGQKGNAAASSASTDWIPTPRMPAKGNRKGNLKGSGTKGGAKGLPGVSWMDNQGNMICYDHHLRGDCSGNCGFSHQCPKIGCSETHSAGTAHSELMAPALAWNKAKGRK